jgi:hypothetical protein
VEFFGVTRLDEDVTEGEVETREQHHSRLIRSESDHHGVIHRRHQVDVGVVQVPRHRLSGFPKLLADAIARFLGERIRRPEPERHNRRFGNFRNRHSCRYLDLITPIRVPLHSRLRAAPRQEQAEDQRS